MRQDFMPVDIERFFFLAAHQVDIELRDAHLAQAIQLLAMLLDGADDAEAIDDFVADEIGVVAADFQIGGSPHGSSGHDFKFGEVTTSFLCTLAHEAEAPVDQVGVGKLEDYTVTDASGGAQGFGAVAGDPDRRNSRFRPGKARADSVVVDRCAGIQFAKYIDELLEIFECCWLLAENATGTIASANSHLHASVRSD